MRLKFISYSLVTLLIILLSSNLGAKSDNTDLISKSASHENSTTTVDGILNELFIAYELADCENETRFLDSYKALKKNTSSTSLLGEAERMLMLESCDECPDLAFASLQGIIGYPQVSELSLCGVPDTVSLLMYNAGDCPLTNLILTVNFDSGLSYGGFVEDFNGKTVSELNVSDASNPQFLITSVDSAEVFILNFGISADCDVDFNSTESLNFDMSFEYTYDNTASGSTTCTGVEPEIGNFNNGIKVPVLNVLSVTPTTLALTSSNTPGCQSIVIRQDGLGAKLADFNFDIFGHSDDYTITSIGTAAPSSVPIPFTVDPISGVITGNIDATQIATIGNGDNSMDANEQITVEVCYEVTGCLEDPMFLNYQLTYGCNGKTCGEATNVEAAVTYEPDFGASAVAASDMIQYGGICGDNVIFQVTLNSANTDPLDGLWEDLSVKFNACLGGNLSLVAVNMNGAPVPTSIFSEIGTAVELDFTQLTSDVDGPGGLEDTDGDGLFDELPGGNSVIFDVEIEIGCSTGSLSCNALACSISNIEVNGKRNCGQDFQQFAPLSEPINFFYGETSSTNNNVVTTGYSLPITEVVSTVANTWNPFVEGYNFTYEFGSENIGACSTGPGNLYAQIVVTANGNRINHLRYEEGTATYMGVPVAGVTWDYDEIVIDAMGTTDTISLTINIPAGDTANDGGIHDYYFNLEAEGDCFPWDYMNVSFQAIEECDACGDPAPCKIIRSCNSATTYVQWRGVACVCDIQGYVEIQERTNYGYTDKSMTTKIDTSTIPEIDKSRYLPGDTMYVRQAFEILNAEQVLKADGRWDFVIGTDGEVAAPVIPDYQHGMFGGWFLKKGSTGVITEIGVPTCMQDEQFSDENRGALYEAPYFRIYNLGVEGLCNSTGDLYGTCPTNPRINPNYPPEGVVDYLFSPLSVAHPNNDRPAVYISWGRDPECTSGPDYYFNDCYEDFLAEFPIEDGDVIYIDYTVPMMHNPNFDLQALNGTSHNAAGNFYNYMTVREHTPACGLATIASSCNSGSPYFGHIPGPVAISTDVVVTDCDIQVNYDFTLTNPVPTPAPGEPIWFENEFRYAMAVEYLEPQFPSNLAYLGDGTITMPDGTIVDIPASNIDEDAGNLSCVVDGDAFCCVAENSEELMSLRINDDDYNVLKELPYTIGPDGPYESGLACDDYNYWHKPNDPFPMFSVGGSNDCDWSMNFSLTALCPEDVESSDFRLKYQFADRYLTDLFAKGAATDLCSSSNTGIHTSYNSYPAPYGTLYAGSHTSYFPMNPYSEGDCTTVTAGGYLCYHFQSIVTHPDASPQALNPMRQTGELITTPDNFTDNSLDYPPLMASLNDLLIADEADVSEFNTYEVCAGLVGGGATHMNVVSSITVDNSIEFQGVTDGGGAALAWVLSSTTALNKTYAVSMPDLAPGECTSIIIETELLFCPVGLDITTDICVSTVSGCLDPEKAAALAGVGEGCNSASECYKYIAEEADLQAEWQPDAIGEIPLCSVVELNTVVKNVKPANLIDLETQWWFPAGLNYVPGSWQVCYPGGPNVTGPCVTVPDPTGDPSQNTAYGTYFEYLDDQIWSSQLAGDPINSAGLPGSLSSMDSNFVKFVFEVETVCDDFISGTSIWFQADAADPCEQRVESMFVPSPPIIVDGANPADFAQFFVFADPVEASCGTESFLTLTYLNTSAIGVTENSMVCMDIETSTFNYMPGSVSMVSPATYSPTFTETTNGSITHICFDIPDGIGPGQVFQTGFAFSVPEDLACGEQDLGVAVSSELMSQSCMDQGIECSVGVLNSVNPIIEINYLPPVTVESQDLRLACSVSPGVVEACYEVELVNNGATYNNDVNIAIIYDVDQNGQLDDYDVKLNEVMTPVLITAGDTIMLSGCIEIPADQSCPVFLMVMQETNCVCDAQDFYYDSLEPDLGLDGRTTFGICPGEPFGMEFCGDFSYELVPTNGGTITTTADSLYVVLNSGTSQVTLNVTGDVGQCDPFDYNVTINSLMDFELGPYGTVEACSNSCTVLNAGIPIEYQPNITVEWVPATYLDDPTSMTPMMCNPTSDITYTVVATFTAGDATCVFNNDMNVIVSDPVTNDIFSDLFLCQIDGTPVQAPAGKDNYFWYLKNDDGTSTIAAVGESFAPTEAGTYYLDCFNSDDTCHTYSNEFSIQPCVDLALIKTINQTTPGPYALGSTITFDVTVFNQSPTIDMYNVYVKDYFPECLVLTDPAWSLTTPATGGANGESVIISPIAFIPANGQQTRTITFTISPTCDTSMPIFNNAEISAYDDDNDPMTPPLPDEDSVADDNSMTPSEVDSDNNYDDENPNMPGSEDDPVDSDDYDFAFVEIFDLALTKVLDTPTPYAYGDELSFTVEVTNQGNVPATNILVTDYLPSGYAYVSGTPAWTANGNNIETTIAGPLAPGASMPLVVVLELLTDNSDGETSWINEAEISSAVDGNGDPVVDVDSTPDNDPTNDAGGEVFSDSDDVVDGDGSGDPDDEDPLTDEDDADPAGIEIVDVALTKMPVTGGPFGYGDVVEFEIEIFNQGSVTLTEIDVIDYLPCGYEFVASNSPTWTYNATDHTASTTIAGPLVAGQSNTITMFLEVIPCTDPSGDAYTNVAEVSSMLDGEGNDVSDDDIDSMSDDDSTNDPGGEPNGTTDDVVDGTDGDEDDSDPAIIDIFDLALTKTLADAGPYNWMDDITFDINITNQGNVMADNILVTDYMPSCFILNDGAWTDNGDDTAEILLSVANGGLTMALAPGATMTIPMTVTVGLCQGEIQTNWAEISSVTDENGDAVVDVDSTPDATNGNDAGGTPDSDEDNHIDDNGMDQDGDGVTDEDDHDPEQVQVQVYADLALIKTLGTTQDNPVMAGDAVQFQIQVLNQGPIPTDNIEVTDYIPACLTLNDAAWMDNGGSATQLLSVANGGLTTPLQPGNSVFITIDFIVNACPNGVIENWAEISAFTGPNGEPLDDIDSVPDNTQGNDTYTDNNDVSGDGNNGGDEDDHDPEQIVLIDTEADVFDLALAKTLAPGQPSTIGSGDIVVFQIEVINQGTFSVDNINVVDYIPSCMTLVDTDWTSTGAGSAEILLSVANGGLSAALAPGQSVFVTIDLLANTCSGLITNWAEIESSTDDDGNVWTDVDSTPDGDNTNDTFESDNDTSGNGNTGGDEDDHDPASVTVVPDTPGDFDLALIKTLSPGQANPIAPGASITFDIDVINQGDISADNIVVTDYMPSCLLLTDSDWTDNGDGTANITLSVANGGLASPLLPGGVVTVPITLQENGCGNSTQTNWAEITEATDSNGDAVTDIDSTPDDDQGNDPYGLDDQMDGDGSDDEDDHDPEQITISDEVVEEFDLALIKILSPGQTQAVEQGDLVNFDIQVTNQGNVSADNITVIDYIPECLVLMDADWTDNGNETASITLSVANGALSAPLAPNQSVVVSVTMEVLACSLTSTTNWAEISDATDGNGDPVTDVDSTPDDMQGNDPFDSDNDNTGDGTLDEYDHDPEMILIMPPTPIFDLALLKTLTLGQPNPVAIGDDVSFDIQVTNQGEENVDNISIVDYLPACLTLNDTDWTDNGDGSASIDLSVANGGLTSPLAPGQSVIVDVVVTVEACAVGINTNWAEISSFTDENGDTHDDVDSTADNDPDNDNFGGDDEILEDGTQGGDEDDHDPEDITVIDPDNMIFDLALTKTLAPGQSGTVGQGATVTFNINVINQGTVAADNIEVVDYIPSCAMLADPAWTDNGNGTATKLLSVANGGLSTVLQPGMTVTTPVTIVLTNCTGGDITNYAEIADATDEDGDPVDDIDSDPDSDPNNDAEGDNDQEDGDGTDDEDDHDPETITVDPTVPMDFDLALIKELSPGQSGTVQNGDMVNFTITVFNQGDLSADNISVTDFMPSCMSLSDTDWSDNGNGSAVITLSVANGGLSTPLLPGENTQVQITLQVDNCTDGTVTNWAEISSATDGAGNTQTDIDSTPDDDQTNDEFMTDNDPSGDGVMDEDDHDPAEITIDSTDLPVGDFDLALVKVLQPGQSSTVMSGDIVDYDIYVVNQGDISADNVEITEYIPSCFTLEDSDWTDNGDGTAVILLSVANGGLITPILPGESVPVPVSLRVGSCNGTTQTNWAEISDATDSDGNMQTDVDSTADDDQSNDVFGDDDATDGDGTDDEDDHDPETVTVIDELEEVFDLALTKTLPDGAPSTLPPNSQVVFNVNVFNQGNIAADNIELVDYLPSCATLVPGGDWVDNGDGTATIILSVANGRLGQALSSGQSLTVPITLDLNSCQAGTITNWAEIADATDEDGDQVSDVDSTADDDDSNDTYGNDNQTNGDGTDDEDDHDPESINIDPTADEEFDLALIKTLAPGQTSMVSDGDVVVFMITVYNQGNVPADNIQVIDYLPSCMTLNDPNWFYDAAANEAVRILSVANGMLDAPLAPGQNVMVPITTMLNGCSDGPIVNYAEIESATDSNGDPVDDIDSTADDDNTNDTFTNDNDPNGDGLNGGDEDDSDPEVLQVITDTEPDVFDLGLIKIVAPGQINHVEEGDNLIFQIQVTNQGDIPADNISVIDYMPACTSLDDTDWTDNGDGTASITVSVANGGLPSPLTPGQSVLIPITTLIGDCPVGDHYNWSEITDATDAVGDPVTDIDSDPDNDPDNDTFINDNDNSGDGMNGGDEDDHDPELFVIDPVFDLALQKVNSNSGPYAYGDNATFDIIVYNQGNVPATNISVVDYMPSGYIFNAGDNTGWTLNVDGTLIYLITDVVAPSTNVVIPLVLEVTASADQDWVNYAEVSGATDEDGNDQEDVDSQLDDFQDNDNDVDPGDDNDNVIDEDVTNGGDEDDSDPAGIDVFDLAIAKTTDDTGPYRYGDIKVFQFRVYNQGNVTASNVLINDFIPCGYRYLASNDSDWTYDGATSTASTTFTGLIQPGAFGYVEIELEIIPCETGLDSAWENIVEIESAEDENGDPQDDVDGDFDDDPNNDGDPIDDEVEDPNDEDNHDPEELEIYDLALSKRSTYAGVDSIGPFIPGDVVEFQLDIYNQGNVTAYDVEITDYLNAGYVFDPSLNPGWTLNGSDLLQTTIAGPFAPGDQALLTVNLIVQVLPTNVFGDWYNEAEISGGNNVDGEQQVDADSDPDTDPDNDNDLVDGDDDDPVFNNGDDNDNVIDEQIDDPNNEGDDDEDDNDAAEVLVTGEIGDEVFKDTDGDGIQDDNEAGVEGVIVNLFDCDGNYISSDTTDATGYYLFDLLLPGGYQLEFDISNLPPDCDWTYQNQGGDDAADSDVNEFGMTGCIDLDAGEMNHDVDAGLIPLAKIGDLVWEDCNGDGIQNPGEQGLEHIQVFLHAPNGVIVSMTYTDENGAYIFDQVYPGDYYLEFVLPTEYYFTFPKLGNNLGEDSDVNGLNGSGTTSTFSLFPGECDLNSGDAGLYECVQIGDLVWFDINENDVWDSVENGVNGMRVNLFRQGTNGLFDLYDYTYTGHKPGTASDDGYFKFCAPPGTYYVEFVEPPFGMVSAIANQGNIEENDSDVTGTYGPGTTNSFSVTCEVENCSIGAGYYPMGTIGDFVFLDANQNGLREANEVGVGDVYVQAFNVDGELMGETMSQEDGSYMLDYLQQADVYLKFTTPPGYASTMANMGPEEMDSDIDNSNGYMTTKYYDVKAGEHTAHVDAGLILGVVPVTWSDFYGEQRTGHNWLQWDLAMEFNVSHYEIERSINSINDFTSIGKTLSLGDSSAPSSYNFEDYNIFEVGVYYYRIKQHDINGDYSYSEIIALDTRAVRFSPASAKIYPNPSIGEFSLEIDVFEDQASIDYMIYNSNGVLATAKKSLAKSVSFGSHIFLVDETQLTPGVYTIHLNIGSTVLQKKLIVINN